MNNFRSGFGGSIPPVTLNIIIINVILWLAQIVFLRQGISLTEKLGLHYVESQGFRIYQLVTYMFLHDTGSFMHVFFNMFAVFMFGRTLEHVWGPKRFLTFYMVTGIGAGLVQLLVAFLRIQSLKSGMSAEAIEEVYTQGYSLLQQNMNYINDASGGLNLALNSVTVGASGAVFGILLAFGMLFPNAELFIIPFPFPIKAKWFVIGYGVFELFFGISNFSWDNVAHFAHLGGMLFGIVMILYWRKKDKIHGNYF
ncbi:MAG: rhomboid family intramembrane serine protease [Bacteroidia bacterium]|nr:rhomboid family intramembrane serine protease [Bacteroidia bacterium]